MNAAKEADFNARVHGMLDEAYGAQDSGISGREFAKNKGVSSTMTDADAADAEAAGYRMKMDGEEGSGYNGGKGADEVQTNTWRSKEDLIIAATTQGKGGVTPVGRAFQKHAGNPSRAGTFVGEVTGSALKNTEQGTKYIESILSYPESTYTLRHTDVFGDILDVRLPDGTGARWSADGKRFIGFLEKYTK